MDPTEFERMDSARRKIRSMAAVLLDSLEADYTITNLNLIEDNLFEAADVIISAAAEEVADNCGHAPIWEDIPKAREPDENAILGRDEPGNISRRKQPIPDGLGG